MEAKELNLNITGNGAALDIRHGKLLDQVQLSKVRVNGNIYAVAEYIKKKFSNWFTDGKLNIEGTYGPHLIKYTKNFAARELSIQFDEYPDHPITGAVINGSLKVNKELTDWNLNSSNFMTPASAIEFVQERAHHFGSVKEAQDLISLFRNFDVTFETVRQQANDGRGNMENAIKDAIKFKTGELPKELRIVLPLFAGTKSVTLNLEIELTRKGNDAALAFYCLELETVLRDKAEEIISGEVDQFRGAFICIEQQ